MILCLYIKYLFIYQLMIRQARLWEQSEQKRYISLDQEMYLQKYYKLYDANQFKNDSLKQPEFYQIDKQQFKSTQYSQLVQHLSKHLDQVGITQITNIYKRLKYKFKCHQKNNQEKIQQKFFINQQLTQIVIYIQYKVRLSYMPLKLQTLRSHIHKKIISDKIFQFKSACIHCKKTKSRICEEANCYQQKLFCFGCDETENKHLFHKNARIQYKEIQQVVRKMDSLKLEVLQSSKLLSSWKQILQLFSSQYARDRTIKMFMHIHEQSIYFFEFSSPQSVFQANTQKKYQFPKFPEKFHLNILKLRVPYFTLSEDQYGALSRIQLFDSLHSLMSSNIHPDVLIGTKTNKMIDKKYLQALYASKSSTGIVVKTRLKGNLCLIFTLDRNLVTEDEITDILWDDVDEKRISYCKKLFLYSKQNTNEFELPKLKLTIMNN